MATMSLYQMLLLLLLVFAIYLLNRYMHPSMEPFTSHDGIIGKMLGGGYLQTDLENAHGSKPAGFAASPGAPQYYQNADAPHVDPMYREGNPQNTFPQYKRQPLAKW